jgi:S-adenosylmethionine decarboxylase
VRRYLRGVADRLHLRPVAPPRTHLSPLYGLSGWLPLEEGAAVHLYAWDNRRPSFLSVDIATAGSLDREGLVDHACRFFAADPSAAAIKWRRRPDAPTWCELAPDIHRQRLAIDAALDAPFPAAAARPFLVGLAWILQMRVLTLPLIAGTAAWMHWETSGVLLDWRQGVSIDIYTCRPFDPARAVAFLRQSIGPRDLVFDSF